MPSNSSARRATIYLSAVCIFWGGTFSWMKIGTEALRQLFGPESHLASTAFFLLARFVVAAALLPLLVPSSVRELDRRAWRYGFWLSLIFSAGFVLQLFGLTQDDVSPSQSAFLTSLYVVFTPVLAAVVERRLPPWPILVGAPLATLGASFITGPPTGGLSLGAWSTVACALGWGGYILLTDRTSRRVSPMALTLTTLLYSTVWMLMTLLAAPGGRETLAPALVMRAFGDLHFVLPLLACAVLATDIAVAVLNRWQKELDPSRAAIIYTSEPVFAAIISLAGGAEQITGWLAISAAAIFLANVVAGLAPAPSSAAAPEPSPASLPEPSA